MAAPANCQAAIWNRVIQPDKNGLSPPAAKALLRLTFSEQDRSRMTELGERNQEGLLTAAERQELEEYVKVGDILSLIHLKARKSLAPSSALTAGGRGCDNVGRQDFTVSES